jgi:hypothetical protein
MKIAVSTQVTAISRTEGMCIFWGGATLVRPMYLFHTPTDCSGLTVDSRLLIAILNHATSIRDQLIDYSGIIRNYLLVISLKMCWDWGRWGPHGVGIRGMGIGGRGQGAGSREQGAKPLPITHYPLPITNRHYWLPASRRDAPTIIAAQSR